MVRRFIYALVAINAFVLMVIVPQAAAITQNDIDCANQGSAGGTCFYQETCVDVNAAAASDVGTGASGGKIYILGDSITNIAKTSYQKRFDSPWTPTIAAKDGRQIEGAANDGVDQARSDKDTIKSSDVVVVALGTNGIGNTSSTTKKQTSDLIKEIKKYKNDSAPLYWVNTYDYKNKSDSRTTNRAIEDALGSQGKIVDWYTAADKNADGASFESGYHPTKPKDIDLLVNLVFDSVDGGSSTAAKTIASGGQIINSSSTPKNGQSLGGVAGTGFTQEEIDKAKKKPSSASSFKGANDFQVTTYGPPWDATEGGNETSTGLSLAGPNNSHGKPRYEIAVDPSVIPYGTLVTVWPNAVKWKGAFLAADTGTAIKNHHVDVYDWSGDGTKDKYTAYNAEVKPYTGSTDTTGDPATDQSSDQNNCCPTDNSTSQTADTSNNLTGKNNKQKAFNYFVGKGLNEAQAAAFVGNFQQESQVVPTAGKGGGHIGIAQWDSADRWPKLVAFAKTQNKSPWSLGLQLDFVWYELNGGYKSSSLDPVKKVANTRESIPEAVHIILNNYEGAQGQQEEERKTFAFGAWDHYRNGGDSTVQQDQASANSDPAGGSCSCQDPNAAAGGDGTIVLDPGHSPQTEENARDPKTGLFIEDYDNKTGEMTNAFTAATKIEKKLKAKGYKVIVTKSSATDKFDLAQRAAKINATGASLAVTLHSDGTSQGELMYPGPNSKRVPKTGSRTDGKKGLLYPDVVEPSTKAAKTMAPIIAKGIGVPSYKAKSFYEFYGENGLLGNGKNIGNTPVQVILQKIPSVYSEVSESMLPTDKFADAMTDAIVRAVPKSGDASSSTSSNDASSGGGNCAASGSIQAAIQTAIKYAWADGSHGNIQKPDYAAAVKAALAKNLYVGGGSPQGDDCGGFVTRVMQDSGADPDYNKEKKGPTADQMEYMNKHPDKYEKLGTQSSDKNLQPGDIAITATHTLMYVGKQSGFNGNMASASLPNRAPNAGNVYFVDVKGVPFQWYRFKGGN